MNCTECTAKLNDCVDGQLPAAEARATAAHVASCAACRRELEALRALLATATALPRGIAPRRDLWAGIRSEVERVVPHALSARRHATQTSGLETSRSTFKATLSWFAPLAIAASVAAVFTVVERLTPPRPRGPAWSVAALEGAPRVDAKTFAGQTAFRVGQWLETDAASRAEVTVGAIGRVTLDSNSRLRLATAAEKDHRLELARGSLSAFIYAPPRIFFVDTPSATAVDLGCAYTLKVNDDGDGALHVSLGYVALEHKGRESIIPSGAMCFTRRGAGPGTPFVEDASGSLRAALEKFDFQPGAARSALQTILTEARAQDAITLWHLLARTAGTDRENVFDRLASHHAPPAGVTRAGILSGESAMRTAWGLELGIGTFGR